jgi:hypothetical protein
MKASNRAALFLIALLTCFASSPAIAAEMIAGSKITGYQAVLLPFYDEDGTLLAAVRRFRRGVDDRLLVLDPNRFTFREMSAARLPLLRKVDEETWRQTPFFAALTRQTAPPYPLQNDGLRHAEHPVAGFFLTADLCPTKKPLDRTPLTATEALPLSTPVPVALMVSGLWIERHGDDLGWLKGRITAQKLAITWVNHSYTHFYDPDTPLVKNFLLRPGTDIVDEALRLERLLIENDLMPSPFFRFPGLVSDDRLIGQLRSLSLIPIGADAWLAKGEAPSTGSIILVHANGNEPEGIRLLLAFYDRQREAFRRGDSALLPMQEAFLPR